MKTEMKTLASIAVVLLLLACSNTARAQFLKKLEGKIVNTAERVVERKAEQKTEAAVGKAVDKSTDIKTYESNKTGKNKRSKKNKNEHATDTVSVKEEDQ